MVPTLQVLSDGAVWTSRDLRPLVGQQCKLSTAQMQETITSGQRTYENRIGWALSFLTNIGAITRPSRGHYSITDAGRFVLKSFRRGSSNGTSARSGTTRMHPFAPMSPP